MKCNSEQFFNYKMLQATIKRSPYGYITSNAGRFDLCVYHFIYSYSNKLYPILYFNYLLKLNAFFAILFAINNKSKFINFNGNGFRWKLNLLKRHGIVRSKIFFSHVFCTVDSALKSLAWHPDRTTTHKRLM